MAKETDLIRVSMETKEALDKLKPSHLKSITYDELIKQLLKDVGRVVKENKQEGDKE